VRERRKSWRSFPFLALIPAILFQKTHYGKGPFVSSTSYAGSVEGRLPLTHHYLGKR